MRKLLGTIGLAATLAGASLLGAPAAAADVGDIASGSNNGILNGNDIAVQVPINVCGNSLNILAIPVKGGNASAVCNAEANAQQGLILADNDTKNVKKDDDKDDKDDRDKDDKDKDDKDDKEDMKR